MIKLERRERKMFLNTYMSNRIKPVFDRLIVELLASSPDDLIQWSVDWLQEKGKNIVDQAKIIDQAQDKLVAPPQSDSDNEETIDDLPMQRDKNQNRTGVSAEVYGFHNKKGDFIPRIIPKTVDQQDRIRDKMSKSFMFSALDEKEQKIVIDAMEEKQFQQGDWVIKQGDDGNELYVIDQGQLDCFKAFKKDEEPVYLKTYRPGESFGELALLYNAPRAASIQATTDSLCFALDRDTFNNIVKDAAVRKREKFDQILQKIDLLQSMDPYERIQLGDGSREEKYKAGEVIIKQGEIGNKFYMISEGELVATKQEDGIIEQVFEYKQGDYFGELALIKNIPRQATVTAKTDVHLIYLDAESFGRLLGPLEDILKRNSDRYEKYK